MTSASAIGRTSRARTLCAVAVVAIASSLAGCEADREGIDTTLRGAGGSTQETEVSTSAVTCGEYLAMSQSERDGMRFAGPDPMDVQMAVTPEFMIAIGPGASERRAVLADGTSLSNSSSVLAWECKDADPSETLSSVEDASLASSPLTCSGFLSLDEVRQDLFVGFARGVLGDVNVALDSVRDVCIGFPDSYFADSVRSVESLAAQLKALGHSWPDSGALRVQTSDDYMVDVSVLNASLGDASSSIVNAPPGYTDVSFTIDFTVTATNATSGRANPHLPYITAAPVWAPGSRMCDYVSDFATSVHGWNEYMYVASPSSTTKPGTGCTIGTIPSFLRYGESMHPGETLSDEPRTTFTAQVPVDVAPELLDELTSGSGNWVVISEAEGYPTLAYYRNWNSPVDDCRIIESAGNTRNLVGASSKFNESTCGFS